ncbi:MAG TPA: HU family DNA-binding protein [Spirochaetota bacterium]|nr:HU family DNA-binding protein [Spirochaetota bacterium]
MTKTELINAVWQKLPYSENQKRIGILVDTLFDVIASELTSRNQVKIRNFGTFFTRKSNISRKKLPGSSKFITTKPLHKIKFKPGLDLKNKLN